MKKYISYVVCGIIALVLSGIFGIAVLALSGIILILGSCGSGSGSGSDKRAIEEVLKQDQWSDYKTVKEKYNQMSNINLTKCPANFRKKYIEHTNAWGELALVEHEAEMFKARYDSGPAYLEAFLRGMVFDFGMVGEVNAAQKELRDHYFRALKMRKDTWNEVLSCAAEYGVDTSKYR